MLARNRRNAPKYAARIAERKAAAQSPPRPAPEPAPAPALRRSIPVEGVSVRIAAIHALGAAESALFRQKAYCSNLKRDAVQAEAALLACAAEVAKCRKWIGELNAIAAG